MSTVVDSKLLISGAGDSILTPSSLAKKTKKLRFAPGCQLQTEKDAPKDHSLSENDQQLLWYTQEDMKQIRRDILQTVAVMRGKAMRQRGQCSRGIEFLQFEADTARRQELFQKIQRAVLDEQQSQLLQGKKDVAAALAAVSMKFSSDSRRFAAERGRRDALAVQQTVSKEVVEGRRRKSETLSTTVTRETIQSLQRDGVLIREPLTPKLEAEGALVCMVDDGAHATNALEYVVERMKTVRDELQHEEISE